MSKFVPPEVLDNYPTPAQARRVLAVAGNPQTSDPYISLTPEQVNTLQEERLLPLLRDSDMYVDKGSDGMERRLELPLLQSFAADIGRKSLHLAHSPYSALVEAILEAPNDARLQGLSHGAIDGLRLKLAGGRSFHLPNLVATFRQSGEPEAGLPKEPLDAECRVFPDLQDKSAIIIVNPNAKLMRYLDADGGYASIELVESRRYIPPAPTPPALKDR